jgi:phage tail sheath protein FI
MPLTLSYPGVYIEEVPSEVRTITGVATSITAFVGRAVRGQVNTPTIVNSLADFNRAFGGLGGDFPMSYAVRDFFLNGGSQAVIVRLFHAPDTGDGMARFAIGGANGLRFRAWHAGSWGEGLRVQISLAPDADVAARLGVQPGDLFNVTVTDTNPGGRTEQIRNVTAVDSARRVDVVLRAESNLLRWDGTFPTSPPVVTAGSDAVSTADETLAAAQAQLRAARNAVPQVPADIEAAVQAVNAATTAVADAKAALGAEDSEPLENADYLGDPAQKTGIFALDKTDLFNLLCIPPDVRTGDTTPPVWQAALEYCVVRRAMLIVDSPAQWSENSDNAAAAAVQGLPDLGLVGTSARNAALYFPRVLESDPLADGRSDEFVPCGLIAGAFARMDTQRGVWKAPAGLDATLNGTQGLNANLTDLENGQLNPIAINVLRSFPLNGRVIWGARTLRGADQLSDQYKYVPVRRVTLFIEESLFRGTKFAVFEPNDEPLWSVIRLNVGAFMNNLFRQGAFQGQTPRDAYFVRCDKETTTQNDIDLGIVNIIVGFAPLKPAEFVVIKIQQIAGQVQT